MIDEKVIEGLEKYLKKHYIPSHGLPNDVRVALISSFGRSGCGLLTSQNFSEASEYINKHRELEDFARTLDKKREEKGLTPPELYKKANIDKRLYSRLMGPEPGHPSKNTAISFAFALRLDRQEFDYILQTAGYALSISSERDLCFMFCLEEGIYSIFDVDELLLKKGFETLLRDTG
jgi:hypothetical protein